jgi:heptosyltransferase-3
MQTVRLGRAPRRILVLAQPGFGDVLLATPLIRSLKRAWPDAAIDVMTHAGREAMLAGNPDVRRCVPIPKRPNPLQFLGMLARTAGRYDLTMAVATGDRGMFLLRCAGRRCLAQFRAVKRKDWWKRRMITAWNEADRDAPEMLRYLRLADLLGIERSYEVVAPHDARAPERLDEGAGFDWRREPYAVIHPTTHATRKRWRIDAWAAVGRDLAARGLRCAITGGPADEPAYVAAIRDAIGGGTVDVAGRFALAEVRALVERSRLYVGVDTSTTHLAAALGTPTVAIYGPGPTNRWAPWPRGHASGTPPFADVRGVRRVGNVCLVQADCDCGEDYRNGCGKEIPGRSRCLEALEAGAVRAAIGDLIG